MYVTNCCERPCRFLDVRMHKVHCRDVQPHRALLHNILRGNGHLDMQKHALFKRGDCEHSYTPHTHAVTSEL